jgi:hypothetical protein
MAKTIAILQSNYIPWKGYFDLINMVDEFILYDEVQYTKNDWRNRNRIKTQSGTQWLTIPVLQKALSQKICETRVASNAWRKKHWKTLCQCYSKAAFFGDYERRFEQLYLGDEEAFLSQINHAFLRTMNEILGIDTQLSWSSDYELVGGKTEKLVELCKQAGATAYVSGPAAKSYLEEELFEQNSIELSYINYESYPKYAQLFPPFEHSVTALDLIFNEGPNAPRYMKSFG